MPDLLQPDGSVNPERLGMKLDLIATKIESNHDALHAIGRDLGEKFVALTTTVDFQGRELQNLKTEFKELVTRNEFDMREREQEREITALTGQIGEMRHAMDVHARKNDEDFAGVRSLIDVRFRDLEHARNAAHDWTLKRLSFLVAFIAVAVTIVGIALQNI